MIIYLTLLKKINNKKIVLVNEANRYAKEFNDKLSIFEDSSLVNWNNNKRSLKVKYSILPDKTMATYKAVSNTICFRNLKSLEYIIHELFHVASTITKKDYIEIGFEYNDPNNSFGKGLNEGYTEHLAKKYFKNFYKKYLYKLEEHYASLLEEIVSDEMMERFYLKANIHGLINYLLRYDTFDNIMDFITTLDEINKNKYVNISLDTLSHLNRLLLSWYIKKSKLDYSKHKIDENKLHYNINNYLNKLDDLEYTFNRKQKKKSA